MPSAATSGGGDETGDEAGDRAAGDRAGGDWANGDWANGDWANGDWAGGDWAGDLAVGDSAGGDAAGGVCPCAGLGEGGEDDCCISMLQHSSITPSAVGQQLPVSSSAAQAAFASQMATPDAVADCAKANVATVIHIVLAMLMRLPSF